MRTRHTLFLGLLPLTAVLLVARQGQTLRAAPAASKAPSPVGYKAGMSQYLASGRSIAMTQGVEFTQDDAVLRTDHATALTDGDANLLSADAPGPVHLFDAQDDLTGRRGSVDFTHHLARLSDSIVLRVTPGRREAQAPTGSPRRQFRDPATLTCAAMTYDYRRKLGKIPGPLTVRQVIQQKDGPLTRTLTAEGGLYNGKAQTILLVGTVRGLDSDGNVIAADTRASGKAVVIGIREGAESISVPFKINGQFKVKPETDGGKDAGDGLDELPAVPPAAPVPASPTPAAPPPDTAASPPPAAKS